MSISVAELTASLEMQIKGFSEATAALNTLATNFSAATSKMDDSLKKVTSSHEKTATAAKNTATVVEESSDKSANAMTKQNNILFNMDQAVKKFGASAALVWPESTRELQVLNGVFEKAKAELTSQVLTYEQLSAVQNTFNATLNRSQAVMKQQVMLDKMDATEKRAVASALLAQENALARSNQRWQNLIVSVNKSNLTDEQKVNVLRQLETEYKKLENILNSGVLTKPQLYGAMNQFATVTGGASREIKMAGPNINSFTQGMNNMGKAATLAMGPLSGVVARVTAFDYLLKEIGAKQAAFAAGVVGLGVVWYKSVENAAAFELGVAKTSAALSLSQMQTNLMRKQLLGLSQDSGVTTEALNKIALSAGQAGVSFSNLTGFTRVVAQLTKTTNLTAEDAADSLIKLANVTKFPLENIQHLGDIITKVGQSSVGGEGQVLHLATEISKAGQSFGFTAEKAIAWGGALADSGQESEAASTAIVAGMQKIMAVIDGGGEKFSELAKFIGMTDEALEKTFKEDGTKVLQIFLEKLGQVSNGVDKFRTLQEEGIINVRTTRVLSALATVWQRLSLHMKEATDITQNAGTLQNKYNSIMDTASQKNQKMITHFQNISILLGSAVLPAMKWFQDVIIKITNNAEGLAIGLGAISAALAVIAGKWTISFLFTQLTTILVACEAWIAKTNASMAVATTSTESFSVAMGTLNKAFMKFLPYLLLYAGYKLLIEKQVDDTKALSDAQEDFNKKYGRTLELMKSAYEAGDSIMFKKTIGEASNAIFELNKQIDANKAKRWGGSFVDEMNATKDVQNSWWADPVGNLIGGSIKGSFDLINKGLDQENAKLAAMKDKWGEVLAEFGVTITSKAGQIFQAIQNMNDKVLSALTLSTYTLFNRLDGAMESAAIMAQKGAAAGKRQLEINAVITPEVNKLKNYDSEKGIREYAKTLHDMGEGKSYSFSTDQVKSVSGILDNKGLSKDEKLKQSKALIISYLTDVGGQIVDTEHKINKADQEVTSFGKHTENASKRIASLFDTLSAQSGSLQAQMSAIAKGDETAFKMQEAEAANLVKIQRIKQDLGDYGVAALKKYNDEHKNTKLTMDQFITTLVEAETLKELDKEATQNYSKALKELANASVDVQTKMNKLNLELMNFNKSDMDKKVNSLVTDMLSGIQKVIDEQTVSINVKTSELGDKNLTQAQRKGIEDQVIAAQAIREKAEKQLQQTLPGATNLAKRSAALEFVNGKKSGTTGGTIDDLVNQEKDYKKVYDFINKERATDLEHAAEYNAALLVLDEAYMSAKLALWDNAAQSMTAGIAAMFGKQNALYKAAFAIEKGFAVAKAALSLEVAIAKAWELGWPAALVAVPSVIAGVGGLMSAIGSINMANGGFVSGPGGSKSDSIPARLSNGEFVMNAAATSKNRSILEAMNSGAGVGASSVGGSSPNIVIQNFGTSKNFETQVTENDIRIICRDEDNKNTRKILHQEAGDANSQFRKILNKNLRVTRKIGSN